VEPVDISLLLAGFALIAYIVVVYRRLFDARSGGKLENGVGT